MTDRDREIVRAIRGRLSQEALADIRRILVFGSRARGDATPDSDLDLAVIVESMGQGIQEALDEAAYAVMWDMDFSPIVSLKVFTEAQFKSALSHGYSFYRNIEREGIPA